VAYERSAAGATFSGWTGGFAEVADVDGGATTMAVGVATKTSTGAETGTFAVTQAATVVGHCTLFVMAIAGWHGTTAPELTALAVGTAAAADAAALSPSWGAADTLWIAVAGNGETSGTGSWLGMGANTPPTSYTDGNSPGLGSDVVGGIEDVGTWSTHDLSNARNCALLIAVRPAVDPDATVTPSTVAAVASVPSVTIAAGSTVTPATVTAVAAVPAPTVVVPAAGPPIVVMPLRVAP
jgi:hypothetical protein